MHLDAVIAPQRGHLFPWVPVCLALGIGAFFLLPLEPGPRGLWIASGVLIALCLLAWRAGENSGPLIGAITLICLGMVLAGWRTEAVAEPVLGFRYYGPIEGRVIEIDRSASDRIRLTLDQVVLTNTRPDRTPARVRVSLHGDQGFTPLVPGARVILTGHLSPPMGPTEPGGFDFRRMAWFEKLGAVGYTRTPVLSIAAPDQTRFSIRLTALRMGLAQSVREHMPGQPGAFAAAVITGDRSGLSAETLDEMRASNLAHLLAISGLHMGLLSGFVFLALRYGIAFVPYVALRMDGRKGAAVVAIVAATGYLALSGGSVATQRAYVMAVVMLGAVLLDRRALTLRAVALAAVLILVVRPESLLSVGFQMSFAATTALVWVFSQLRDNRIWQSAGRWRGVLSLVLSSAIAGLATAPIGAAHFNQVSQFGLFANLAAVPVMGMVVMPAAVLAACLAPIGLSEVGLWIMGFGCRWILFVADKITSLEAAQIPVVGPGPWVLPLIAGGCLTVFIWQGWPRWIGLAPAVLAIFLWGGAERPPVLIAESAALVGVLIDGERVLNKPRGDGFAARVWLENDGDERDQTAAAQPDKAGFMADLGWLRLRIMTKTQAKKMTDPCENVDLLILTEGEATGCLTITARDLRNSGSLAIWRTKDGPQIITASQRAGVRYWTDAELRSGRGPAEHPPMPWDQTEAAIDIVAQKPAIDQ